MTASEPVHESARIRAWAPFTAAFVPFCVYVLSTGGHSYWLDSGEFTAATVYLDIAHPPGQPLTCLWGKLFTLLPFGPLPFRVALGQATAAALALWALSHAFARTLALTGVTRMLTRELLCVAGCWVLAGSYGFWFQAARQEVYALQALFVCIALERLTYAAMLPVPDVRPFFVATLSLGAGLANHHFITVLALPSLLYELVRLTRAYRARPWLVGLSLGLLGLFGYVYLPIRASTLPPMDLGHPTSFKNLWWVITAKVYAEKAGSSVAEPLIKRFGDLVILLVENLTIWTLLLSVLGLYVAVRTARLRPIAYLWGVTEIVSLVGRTWAGSVSDNPDVLGYMMPGLASLVALAMCGLGALLMLVRGRAAKHVRVGCAALATLFGASQFVREAPEAQLAHFHGTDDFDTVRRRSLSEGAVLVLVTPEAAFRHWDGEAVERLRPDLTMVPVPFLGYGDSGKLFAKQHPDVAPLVTSYLNDKVLSLKLARALSKVRPLLVEADASVSLPLYPYLLPAGVLYRMLDKQPTPEEIVAAHTTRELAYLTLYRALGSELMQSETRRKVLWLHYTDALYYASHGLMRLAKLSTRRGLELAPHTEQLLRLRKALSVADSRPLDIRPFLLDGSR
jgi:hypothetical protein